MKKVWVAWMAERWDEEQVRYEFETQEDRDYFVKGMLGVLHCYEAYCEVKR